MNAEISETIKARMGGKGVNTEIQIFGARLTANRPYSTKL